MPDSEALKEKLPFREHIAGRVYCVKYHNFTKFRGILRIALFGFLRLRWRDIVQENWPSLFRYLLFTEWYLVALPNKWDILWSNIRKQSTLLGFIGNCVYMKSSHALSFELKWSVVRLHLPNVFNLLCLIGVHYTCMLLGSFLIIF